MAGFMGSARQAWAWGGFLAAVLVRAGAPGRSGVGRESKAEAARRAEAMALRWDIQDAGRSLGRHLARDAGLADPLPPVAAGSGKRGGE